MNESLITLIIIVYSILHILSIIWICQEAKKREEASVGKAFVFAFFFTLIAGLLYVSLFPRKVIPVLNKSVSNNPPASTVNSSFKVGEELVEKKTGKKVTVTGIEDKGSYKIYICKTDNGSKSFYKDELIKE